MATEVSGRDQIAKSCLAVGILPDRRGLGAIIESALHRDLKVETYFATYLWISAGFVSSDDQADDESEIELGLAMDQLTDEIGELASDEGLGDDWFSAYHPIEWTTHYFEGGRIGLFARLKRRLDDLPALYGLVEFEDGPAVEAVISGPECTVRRVASGLERRVEAEAFLLAASGGTDQATANAVAPDRAPSRPRSDLSKPAVSDFLVEPPMAWGVFAAETLAAWRQLLSDPDVDEQRAHAFLVNHPCMVPFATSAAPFGSGHHGALHHAVFTKPRLGPVPGGDFYVPDFMRITTDSEAIHVHLIEIESPRKRIVNRAHQLTAKYGQAMSQLADWMGWLEEGANREFFRTSYGIHAGPSLPLSIDYTLIYGRRDELVASERGRRQRQRLTPRGAQAMTFDRLTAIEAAVDDLTVRVRGGRLVAVAVQPTIRCTSLLASRLQPITGLRKAIARNPSIPDGRKEWLISEFAKMQFQLRAGQPVILDHIERRP